MKQFLRFFSTILSLLFLLTETLSAQVPENWQDDTGITTFKESGLVYEGDYSCGITVNTGTQADCDLSNTIGIPVNAGETFKVSFWYFTSEHVRLRAALDWNEGSATYSPNYAGPTSTGDWEEFTYESTVPDNVTVVNLRIRSYDLSGFTAPETQYVDLVTFESPVGTLLTVSNGDFETWPASLPEPTNYPEDFIASATAQEIELTWTDATGSQLPDAYLILANDNNDFIAPEDGNFVYDDFDFSDGEGAANVTFGNETFTFANLNPETTYYFTIYPYTNSGVETDYKTDGLPPTTSATTGALQPELTVISPQEGATWYRGNDYDVLWESLNMNGDVLIEITGNASAGNPVWVEAATVPVAQGSYTWEIPTDYPVGTDFQFRLTGQLTPIQALSGIFSIDDQPDIPLIVINEIMYNPPPELGDDDYWEYVELYNNDDVTVDLSGWSFSEGIDFTFPDNTSMEPGAYLVVARVPDTISNYYGITNLVGPFENGTALSNGGEAVAIADADGNTVDFVEYGDGGDWPSEPDGDGPSLSLISPDLDNSLPESWEASVVPFGTPGTLNNPVEPFIAVTWPNGGEILQKQVNYEITWAYDDLDGSVIIELVSQSGFSEVLDESVDITLGAWEWTVSEDISNGEDYKITITSLQNPDVSDESDGFFTIIDAQEIPNLVITEIMYNPPESGNDSLEFIEIYNNDDFIVNLSGYYFSDGVDFTFPATTLGAGAYLLVTVDSMAMLNTFGVNAWQWSSGALSNGGELIELRDGFDNTVDFVEYSDQQPWDTLADGGGPSLTLCDPNSDNSLPENWLASAELAAVNGDGDEIFATPGGPCVTTGIKHDIQQHEICIYPNPGNGIFTLKGGNREESKVEIFTASGVKIYQTTIRDSEVIDVSGLVSNGLLLVKITNIVTNEIIYSKIIIEK